MKILYFGGQKSGKSRLAERKALALAGDQTPRYIATYNTNYADEEMAQRIAHHRNERKDRFETVEETMHLGSVIKEGQTHIIDCMSMWLLNTLEWSEEALLTELETVFAQDVNVVFVLNNVGSGVIPAEQLSRAYVDRSGIIGQKLAQLCDEVYEVKLGLELRLK